MEIWHVTVFADGQAHDEDFAALETAKAWAAKKLAEIGHRPSSLAWIDTPTSSTARLERGVEVRLTLRTAE